MNWKWWGSNPRQKSAEMAVDKLKKFETLYRQ